MTRRPSNLKIPDIKMVRGLTRFLGKLGIEKCFSKFNETEYIYDSFNQLIGTRQVVQYFYGLGLKESKDYVESKYHYYLEQQPQTPRQEIEMGNQVSEIRTTRRLMKTLERFDIKSADTGLKNCKLFTDRLRARNRRR